MPKRTFLNPPTEDRMVIPDELVAMFDENGLTKIEARFEAGTY